MAKIKVDYLKFFHKDYSKIKPKAPFALELDVPKNYKDRAEIGRQLLEKWKEYYVEHNEKNLTFYYRDMRLVDEMLELHEALKKPEIKALITDFQTLEKEINIDFQYLIIHLNNTFDKQQILSYYEEIKLEKNSKLELPWRRDAFKESLKKIVQLIDILPVGQTKYGTDNWLQRLHQYSELMKKLDKLDEKDKDLILNQVALDKQFNEMFRITFGLFTLTEKDLNNFDLQTWLNTPIVREM